MSDLKRALHGVRLPAARHPVGEEQPVLALQQVLDEGQAHTLKHIRLAGVLAENTCNNATG